MPPAPSDAGTRLARLVQAPSRALAEPWNRALLWLVLAQLTIWTLLPYLLHHSLPLDVTSDIVAWGHEWQWGYYKHPPLPSWLGEIAFRLMGDLGPFLFSQIFVSVTFLYVYKLGRRMMPPERAFAGTALLVGVYYFSLPTPEFNHNIAQLPFFAAAAYYYFDALETRRIRAWLLLGLALGLGMLCKYEIAVLGLAIILHAATSRHTRPLFAGYGPYLSLAVALIVFAPHLSWLVQNDFPTLKFAASRAQPLTPIGRVASPVRFLASQLLDIAVALVVAGFAGILSRGSLYRLARPGDETLRFLLWLGLGPILICTALPLFTGMGLRDEWGTQMWDLIGLVIVYPAGPLWQRVSMKRLARAVVVLFVLLPVAYALASTYVPHWQGRHPRTQWPDRAMAARFAGLWQKQTGKPLRIVAGDGWLAGLIALRSTPRLSVFTDGEYSEAPWITPARLSRDGALVVWQEAWGHPASAEKLPGLKIEGTETFMWPDNPGSPPLRIGWGIVRPVP